MERRFSIGEVSKIHNVSVQTLRHYEKIGLLKPSYVNERSGYRYYSAKHFIMLDFIKECKAIGLTLGEIKQLMDDHTSIDAILEIIAKQKKMIDYKMKELYRIKNHIERLEDRIQTVINEGIGKIFIKHCTRRSFIKYNNTKRYTEEFEIKLSETLRDIEKEVGTLQRELAFATSYETFKQHKQLDYNHMMIGFENAEKINKGEKVVLPEGVYLTLNFDGDYRNTKDYYEKLLEYIERHNMKVGDTFYETYMITRIDINNEEQSLGQIQIQIVEGI